MPAEWAPHRATWLSWPHHEPDWPGKLGPIPWVYAEIVRVIAAHEPVEVLCHDDAVRASAQDALDAHGVAARSRAPARGADRPRLAARLGADRRARRSRPRGARELGVQRLGQVRQLRAGPGRRRRRWRASPACRCEQPTRADTGERLVLEGGGIEVNGAGRGAGDRGVAAQRHAGAQPGTRAPRLRSGVRDLARRAADDLARRRLRRRRHARPRGRHRAVRQPRHRRARGRARPGRRQPRALSSTTSGGWNWRAAGPASARCGSSICRFHAPSRCAANVCRPATRTSTSATAS